MVSHVAEVPLWVALPVSALLVGGAGLTLIGALGLVRIGSFYARIHAPTLGTSWGAAGIILASMLLFSATGERLVVHEILLGVFVTLTTPVTLMLLGRAALYRDRGGAQKKPADPARDLSPKPDPEAWPGAGPEARSDRASETFPAPPRH